MKPASRGLFLFFFILQIPLHGSIAFQPKLAVIGGNRGGKFNVESPGGAYGAKIFIVSVGGCGLPPHESHSSQQPRGRRPSSRFAETSCEGVGLLAIIADRASGSGDCDERRTTNDFQEIVNAAADPTLASPAR